MKNSALLLYAVIVLLITVPAHAECPSDDADFCVLYKDAVQGNSWSQFILGVAYSNGSSVAEDKREAARWYRLAAAQGYAKAQSNLGWMYYYGDGVAEDKREAVRWFRKAAAQGDVHAQSIMGLMYSYGEGVAENKREAVRWYRLAAEQGHAQAQNSLGTMYARGEGVAEDKREATRWYRKAAEQGVAEAQGLLGEMYYYGEGVAEDKREAVRWYLLAAAQGVAEAQFNLGWMYDYGEGIIADEREAYIWYSIAKANGNERAAVNLRENNWDLSQAEIKSARREATRRLAEFDSKQTNVTATPSLNSNITLAKPSQSATVAEQVFEQAWRSVVVVYNGNNQGSGVIIRPNVVATNCHVVDAGGSIRVHKTDNRRVTTSSAFSASIRHADEGRDFCLLDVDGLWGVPATVRKYDTLKVGETVYSLGAPKNLDLSLSAGLISQLRKNDGQRIIQTDAAISPGSSGGGLFDSQGNLVGITTFKFADEDVEGIAFAIPADLVLAY